MVQDLTIIIPCISEVDRLEKCLRTIDEHLPGQHVIVVQMAEWSTTAITRASHVRFVRQKLLSSAAARNIGARQATTDYLFFLDSDNWLIGDGDSWNVEINNAMLSRPLLIVLQRADEQRQFMNGIMPTRWNFSRYCIEWNLIWCRSHFFALGGFDENCCHGGQSMAQAGEGFDICFKHFASRGATVLSPRLFVGHPSLENPSKRLFEYAYGSGYSATRQLRRKPCALSLFWFARSLAGLGLDVIRGVRRRSVAVLLTLVWARLLAAWDGITKDAPRSRNVEKR